MEHFLELAAKDLYYGFSNPLTGLSDVTVVFPNRRARLFFDEYLSLCCEKPLWSPTYMTISELFQSQSPLVLADHIRTIAMLYDIYCEVTGSSETPDSFWTWGELMLRDFDDIDSNMVDADQLFACLENQKEIESATFLTEEQQKSLNRFFIGLKPEGAETELRRKYIHLWRTIGKIYHKLRGKLSAEGLAYEGMLLRNVAESPNTDLFTARKYAFIGFNSLNNAEKRLFSTLQSCGKALFYWDYDESYIRDTTLEAGTFLRENVKLFPGRISPTDSFSKNAPYRELTIVETSSDNAQARFIPNWLERLPSRPDKETAVVLCDSTILQAVLNSLPSDKVDTVNITMGYPLKVTVLYTFVSAFLDTQHYILKNNGSVTLELVSQILNNPLAAKMSDNAASVISSLNQQHKFHPSLSELKQDENLAKLFAPCTNNLQLMDNLLAMLDALAATICENPDDSIMNPLNSEAIYRIYTQSNRFRTLVDDGILNITPDTLCKLLRKVLTGTTIPFHGEPVVGMQIMGLIETRNLDFRHVLLLSASEGTLPSGNSESSFLPYSLRKAFGLTTMRQKSAVSSYNFHHLLQRAESVTMVYNGDTDSAGIGKGQISRYLLQLIVSNAKVQRITLDSRHKESTVSHLVVAKSSKVMQRLYDMYDYSTEGYYLSPSAINCYLDCSLKYWFRYVIGIKPKEDDSTEIAANLFGTLFHKSAELAYNSLAAESDGLITESNLRKLIDAPERIDSFVRQAFNCELFNGAAVKPEDYNGVQVINYEAIRTYLRQVLRIDLLYVPFQYIGSESRKFSHCLVITHPEKPGETLMIRMSGSIDRLDLKGNILRIVDYKTGNRKEEPKSMEDLFSGSKRNSHYLQAFYYATLVNDDAQLSKYRLAPVLLYTRSSSNPTPADLYLSIGGQPATDFAKNYISEYTERLKKTVSEIFDPKVPFRQPDKSNEHCRFCDFASICQRQTE